MLLQCRGVDTAGAVPKGQVRLTPGDLLDPDVDRALPRGGLAHPVVAVRRLRRRPRTAAAVVGAPDPLPEECAQVSEPLTARWLPFRAAGGEVYYGGPGPRASAARRWRRSPTAPRPAACRATRRTASPAPTATARPTSPCGRRPRTRPSAARPTVACALVAVPIVGVSCDAWGTKLPAGTEQTTKAGVPLTEAQLTTADTTCRRTGAYQPGEPRSSADDRPGGARQPVVVGVQLAQPDHGAAELRGHRLGVRRGQQGAAAGDAWARSCSTS